MAVNPQFFPNGMPVPFVNEMFVLAREGSNLRLTRSLGTSIGKRYARTDELGVPLAITVDITPSVTVRDRDSKQQIRVNVDEVASLVKEVTDGVSTWNGVLWRYPTRNSLA